MKQEDKFHYWQKQRDCKEETVKNEDVEFRFVHVKLKEKEKHPSSDIHQGLEIQDQPQRESTSNKMSLGDTNLEIIVKTMKDC